MNHKLTLALDALNNEIEKGYEFPDALYRVLKAFAVSQDALTEAYDQQ